ncbi:MAG: DUF5361 domain-containing protein [Erysipelotrichaceae bacterium]|nr:DUF5361 domain-containing protein [Erysipelotrichaceae bacterium]
MIELDEDALQCDLAETYHIYDMRELPLTKVALFSVGLKGDSRIKLKLQNMKYPFEMILLANIVDRLSYLVWFKTKDGQKGKNRPASIAKKLLGMDEPNYVISFSSANDFERRKREILKGGNLDG